MNPLDLLTRGNVYKINTFYYINKCINPALDRVLGLVGIDVNLWYNTTKKKRLMIRHINYDDYEIFNKNDGQNQQQSLITNYSNMNNNSKKLKNQISIEKFFLNGNCVCCGLESTDSLCHTCSNQPLETMLYLNSKNLKLQTLDQKLHLTCWKCTELQHIQYSQLYSKNVIIGKDCCENIGCEQFYARWKTVLKLEEYQQAINKLSW